MGTYLTLLNQLKGYIYDKRLDAARDTLKLLLNNLNVDYMGAKNPAERNKIKAAMVRLMPALEDLKRGRVGEDAIVALKLDRSRLSVSSGGFKQDVPVPPPPYVPPKPAAPAYPIPPAPVIPQPTAPSYTPPRPAPAYPQPSAPQPAMPQPTAPKPAGGNNRNKIVKNNNIMMPLTLDDYVGQEKAKRSLRISIAAAKKTGRPLQHLMICSSYGLGKTTLTNIIANEMGMPFFNVNATNLKDVRSLSLYFSKLDQSCIVFIDEIHTLKKDVQTVLLSILTDFTVSFIDEEGQEQQYDLPPFTLIGATTQAGELLKPFLNRFAILELEDYTDDEKLILVKSKFEKLGYTATDDAISQIAMRCRGVPRTIETYVKGVIDVALTRDESVITREITDEYFDIHEVDENGLTKTDIKILKILDEATKPLALVTIESKSGIQNEDIAFRYEPYLLKLGLMEKTERGRVISEKGRKYLHPEDYPEPEEEEPVEEEVAAEPELPESTEAFEEASEKMAEEAPEAAEEDAPAADEGSDDDFFACLPEEGDAAPSEEDGSSESDAPEGEGE